jgi:hemerythrin-like metal-binding domain
MEWSSEYEVGITEIDNQHKKWLELLNAFYDNLTKDNNDKQLLVLITEAAEYGKYHFEEEEKVMELLGYPHLDEQKKMHSEIAEKIMIFQNKVQNGQPLISLTVTNEFKSWFRNHILIEDHKIGEFVKIKNIRI